MTNRRKKFIKGIIGPPARESDFWDREEELAMIWGALETSSVLLLAPRRFGKTSIMLKILDEPKPGWKSFYLDTEWIEGPGDFIVELIARLAEKGAVGKIWGKIQEKVVGAVDRIDEIGVSEFKISLRQRMKKEWREKGTEFLKTLMEVEGQIILITDELSLLVYRLHRNSKQEAEEFLTWLRGMRHIPELLPKIRWLMGGSIGMGQVLKDVGIGSQVINDLQIVNVREFSNEKAREFIKILLETVGRFRNVPIGIINKILEVIECPIPYFVQILIRECLNEMVRQKKSELSEAIIDKAYKEGVLAAYNRTYFDHYYERLQKYYGEEKALLAKNLLTMIARRGIVSKTELFKVYDIATQGTGTEDTFSDLLTELENDFYVVLNMENNTYRFATKVLRDWWLRFHTF
ncbi:MAG: hypothetical protein OEZ20_06820 [candidate division WOR-3 bacterium]|nr:hypothetical protein [candidate division WOR-3 bacterium]MDH5684157.1 hypothetical protein [candidate division WOR-3 bacterium]